MPFPLRLRHPPKPVPPASTLPSNHSAAGSGVSAIETSPLVVSLSSIPKSGQGSDSSLSVRFDRNLKLSLFKLAAQTAQNTGPKSRQ
jgi:hypothetical protein